MQKLLWGCAAAALATLGVGYMGWDYATSHPNSWLGRGVINAGKVAATQVKTIETSRHTAELTFKGVQGLLGHTTAAPAQDDCKCPAPVECPMEPAVLPGAVAMQDEEIVRPSQPMPPVHDIVGGNFVVGDGLECEEATMPAVEEEAAKMPPCEEDCCRLHPKKDGKPTAVMPGCHDADTVTPHVDHHSVPQVHSDSEESEPVFPKMDRDGGEKPVHPDVDTMEIRPGDLWFLDFTGPF